MLTGLIWTVQIVHYPLFSAVGPEAFPRYHRLHTRVIAPVVVPLMLVEASTALWLFFVPEPGLNPSAIALSLAMVIAAWTATAFFSVPAHGRLAQGFEERAYRKLVISNWLRTASWTARSLILLGCLRELL